MFGAVCGEIVVWILRKRRGGVCVEMCAGRDFYMSVEAETDVSVSVSN